MKCILLVDGDAHVLHGMRCALDRNGYEVDTALSGKVALRLLDDASYHASVIGADLADMPGLVLCESIQRRYPERRLLTLLVDGNSTLADSEAMYHLPNVEPLEKPVSLRWLVARLNEYFGHYPRAAG